MKNSTKIFAVAVMATLVSGTGIFAQEKGNCELTGKLNADPNNFQRSKKTVALTIRDGGTGPYKAILTADTSLMTHSIFSPADLSVFDGESLLPIIAYGNGGCVNSPDEVLEVLSEVASHGFLVVAIGPVRNAVFGPPEGFSMTDSKLLLDAIDWAIAQNNQPGSPYFGKLATDKIAVMGQSCGGLQALTVSSDPRITTTVCLNSGVLNQPMNLPANLANPPQNGNAPRVAFPSVQKADLVKIHGPVLYLLGGAYDMATPNGTDDFNRIDQVPVVAASYDFTEQVKATGNKGLGHYPATYREPHGGDFTVAAVAWLKWQLKGDQEAAKMFRGNPCGLEKNVKWKVVKKNLD